MAFNYSNDEKVDMLEIYFKSNRNTKAAALAYEEQFPERQQPNQRHFKLRNDSYELVSLWIFCETECQNLYKK